MLFSKGTLRFSCVRFIRGFRKLANTRNYDNVQVEKFDPKKMLSDLLNTSINPFLSVKNISQIGKYYLTKKEIVCSYSYVIDEDVAKDIVEQILTNSTPQDQSIIVEGNPGLGLLTLKLINSGVPKILLFDCSEMAEVSLNQICEKYSDKIIRESVNMLRHPEEMILSTFDHCTGAGVPVTIVGVCHNLNFLRSLVFNYLKHELWDYKFTVFIVYGSPSLKIISNSRNHRIFRFPIYCLFNVLFTVEKLAKYPRSAFLPLSKTSNEEMHLIRITPNIDIFQVLNKNELYNFYFLLITLGTLNNFIIPTLEKWMPNCGPYLISKGVSMTMQTHELSAEESLILFNLLKNYEGFEDFISLRSKFYQK